MRSTICLRVSNEAMQFHDSPVLSGEEFCDAGHRSYSCGRSPTQSVGASAAQPPVRDMEQGQRRAPVAAGVHAARLHRHPAGSAAERRAAGVRPHCSHARPALPAHHPGGAPPLPAPHPTTPTSLAGPVQESTVSSDLMGLPCNDHRHASAGDNSCACCDNPLLTANLPGVDQRRRSSPAMLFCVSVPIASRRVSQAALRRAHTTCSGSAKGLGQVLDRGAGAGGGADIGGAAVWQGMAPAAYRPVWPWPLIRRLSTQISKLSRSLGACLHKVLCRYLMMSRLLGARLSEVNRAVGFRGAGGGAGIEVHCESAARFRGGFWLARLAGGAGPHPPFSPSPASLHPLVRLHPALLHSTLSPLHSRTTFSPS